MEKHNSVEPGRTRCHVCSALAASVVDGVAYCIDHDPNSGKKSAEAETPRLKNAADHLPKAE